MGGEGSGRKPDQVKSFMKQQYEPKDTIASGVAGDFFLPNHSGVSQHPELSGILTHTQTQPSRSLNTTYTNSVPISGQGRPILVYGSVKIVYSDDPTLGDVAWIECKTGNASPPTTSRMKSGDLITLWSLTSNWATNMHFPFFFVVPSGHNYRIDSTTNGMATVTIDSWNEVIL